MIERDDEAFLNKYKILKLIGKGAFSQVFKCETNNHEIVAIKVVHLKGMQEEAISLLQNEIVLLQNNQNNNIIQLIEASKIDQSLFLVLECCFIDLKQLWRDQFELKIPDDLVITIFRQLVNGLHYLHENKIIHRDIKLANIGVKLTAEEEQRLIQMNDLSVFYNAQYKLLDFGVSMQLINEELANQYIGTEQYMAPEVLQCQPYSISADMYSLGVCMFQLITGKLPYTILPLQQREVDRSEWEQCLKMIQSEKADFHLIQNLDLRTIVQKMLKYDPKERLSWPKLYQNKFFQNKQGQTQSILDLQLHNNQDTYSEKQFENNQIQQEISLQSQQIDQENNEIQQDISLQSQQKDKDQINFQLNTTTLTNSSQFHQNIMNQQQKNKIQYWNKLRNICILLNKLSSNTIMLINTIYNMTKELMYKGFNSEFNRYIKYLCDLNEKTYNYLKFDINNHVSEYMQFQKYVILKNSIETGKEFRIIQKNQQSQLKLISDFFSFARKYFSQLQPLDLREFPFGQEGFYEQTTYNNILIYNSTLKIIYHAYGQISEHNFQNFKLMQGQIYRILIDLARVRAMFGADWKWRDEKIDELRLEDFVNEPDSLPQYLTEILQFYQLSY